jgi:FG-GAP repeat
LSRQRTGWIVATRLIARGWNTFSTTISSEDFNGDGKPDIIACGRECTLCKYAGNGADAVPPPKVVGGGRNISSAFLP